MPHEETGAHVSAPARPDHESNLPRLSEIGGEDLLIGFRERDLTAGVRNVPTHALQTIEARIFLIQAKLLAKGRPVALRQAKCRAGSVLAGRRTNRSDPYGLPFTHAVEKPADFNAAA